MKLLSVDFFWILRRYLTLKPDILTWGEGRDICLSLSWMGKNTQSKANPH